ncbi:DUF167 domain-containing protein [Cryptosporangium sp. NPDC051539]|uniref:DUF167 domain-containing protein n=1 Tax=Cryptosporangium sp. NPDC051539 TaxID=3363962 RepID=UPI003798B42E
MRGGDAALGRTAPVTHGYEFVVPVRVKPGVSRPRVGGSHDGPYGAALVVAVSARAVDGKATRATLDAVAAASARPASRWWPAGRAGTSSSRSPPHPPTPPTDSPPSATPEARRPETRCPEARCLPTRHRSTCHPSRRLSPDTRKPTLEALPLRPTPTPEARRLRPDA